MAFNYPYGDTQQLNLNWFLAQWETFREQWATAEEGIDHALDAEIARVEAAMDDLYAARDAAAASKTAAQTAATNAASSETVATQQATLAQSYANTAQTQAGIATAAAEAAGNSASSASTSATAANLSKTQAANSATAAQTAQTAAEAAETNIVSILTDAIQDAADAAAATATADAEAAADAAEASATAAAGSASDASDSATAAAGSASDAADSATAAAGSATAAAGSATAAAGSASDAADSATAAAASAASIVVDSAMSDSSTNPVQNKVINGEITELKTAITEMLDNELYNKNINVVIVQNERVVSSTGVIASDNNYDRSDYIDLAIDYSVVDKVRLFWLGSTRPDKPNALCFYDSSKQYISGLSSPLNTTSDYAEFVVPDNAKYAIYSGYKSVMAQLGFALADVHSPIKILWESKADKETAFGIDYVSNNVLLEKTIGVTKFPNNLIAPSECVDNNYINVSGGNLVASSGYFATGFIPVTAGTTYRSNVGRNLAWYKSDKTYLSGVSGTTIQTGVTAPENAAFVRFTVNKSTDGISTPFDLYFTDTSSFDLGVYIKGLIHNQWMHGKKINWLGDSIVAGSDFDEVVSSALGMIETDYGIDGSTIALAEDGTDGRNACVSRYSSMTNTTDIVAVSCGTNDFEYAWCPIGTINDPDDGTSNNTFYGALKTLCKGLITKYPQKTIFFTTPIKRGQPFADGAGGEYTQDGVTLTPFSKNKYGKTLGDYADIIKEVCGYYSIPVLDLYRESLLNPSITAQQGMFDNVLTHPNSNGQKMMAKRVCGWLTQLSYNIS